MSESPQTVEARVARAFLAHRKRLAGAFNQVITTPDWDDLPEGFRLLSIAAMREALIEEICVQNE